VIKVKTPKCHDEELNILIPMAGLGKRFSDRGFTNPKPLIDVDGVPMIERAINSLGIKGNYIFILKKSKYSLDIKASIKNIKPNSLIREIDYTTQGPATTCNLVRDVIDSSSSLIIGNCDQIMWWNGGSFVNFCSYEEYDGVVVTYFCDETKNSYAKIDKYGMVTEIREKQVISNISLNGIHYWKQGCDFISSYDKMVENNDRAPNGEFYVGPSYNYMIKEGKNIGIYHLPKIQHHAVGTPDDLREYLRNEGS